MTEQRKGDWIQTFSGRQYWPLDPRPEDVDVQDIAHHLSNLCRFTGACKRYYSVAEHSVHVSYLVPSRLALVGLLHDASEAYCNDIARPVKLNIQGYAEIEGLNQATICEALNVPCVTPEDAKLIKWADNAILVAERDALMVRPRDESLHWTFPDVPEDLQRRAHEQLGRSPGWIPALARLRFLRRYDELTA